MNNITLLKDYLTKAEDDFGIPDMLDNISVPDSTLQGNTSDVPPQYRKYLSSFPGGKLPEGLNIETHQGSKKSLYIDIRDLDHDQIDEHESGDANLATSYGGIIFNDKGEVLVRSPKGTGFGNRWTLPKGHPDGNEAAHEAALREVEEETGMQCSIVQEVPGTFQKKDSSNNKYFIMKVESDSGMDFQSDETEKISWMKPEDALKSFAAGDDKDSARRDIAAVHMAIHESHKRAEIDIDADDLGDFIENFDEENPTDIPATFKSFHDHYKENNGELPDDFITNRKYKTIRDTLRYAFLHLDDSNAHGFSANPTSAGTLMNAIRGMLNVWVDEYGSPHGDGNSTMYLFHQELETGFTGDHGGEMGAVINDVVGEVINCPDTYISGDSITPDLDVNGKAVYRSAEQRQEIAEAYRKWKEDGVASGTLESGEHYDFEAEPTAKIGAKKVSPWHLIAEANRVAKDTAKYNAYTADYGMQNSGTQGYIRNKIQSYGEMIANSTNKPDASEAEQYQMGRDMIKHYVETQQNLNRGLLDAITSSNHIILYRGTRSAREIGGDYPSMGTEAPTFKESTFTQLKKAGMSEKGSSEPLTGFSTYTHTRPVSGYSVGIRVPVDKFSGGKYVIAERVQKKRFLTLPINRTNFADEKECFIIADSNNKAQVYHSTERQGKIVNSNEWALREDGSGYHIPGMFPESVGTETPHGTFNHGVADPDAKNEDIYTPANQVLGETSGGVYHDKDNNKFYIKTNDPDQNAVEQLSNTLYKMAGINVADSELLNWKGQTALKSSWIPGAKYFGKENDKSYQPPELESHPDIHQGFLMDCLLANWDVAGAGVKRPYGNLVQGEDGKIYRIDMGGSLYKSGLGQHKSAFFSHTDHNIPLQELDTLKNADINPSAAHLFNSMSTDSLKDSFKAVLHATHDSDAVKQLVDESGIKDQMKDDVITALINRRNSIVTWMKTNHPELHDAAYKEHASEGGYLSKAAYKTDPKIEWLKHQPEFMIDDYHRDDTKGDEHMHSHAYKTQHSIINNISDD